MSPGHIFDVVAIVCFAIAAIPWPTPPITQMSLTALGLVWFTLGHLFP